MEDKADVLEYDMRATLEMLIDWQIPELGTPVKILRSYLVETLAQPGGREMISTLVSPVLGLTVGTALVEHRRNRWAPTLDMPSSLLSWLHEQGVDMHQPDRKGNTAFFHALQFDVPQGAGVMRDLAYNDKALKALFQEPGFDPLRVSPSGQSLLQCPGQNLLGTGPVYGVELVRNVVMSALAEVIHPKDRWGHMMAMEANGVAPSQQDWWRPLRLACQHECLEAGLPVVGVMGRSRF